jgi:hypothetical protein
VGRLSIDARRIADSVRVGVESMSAALYDEPARLVPQPAPHLARAA